MLMRHARVDPDGTYHPPPVAKAAYGTMVFVRADSCVTAPGAGREGEAGGAEGGNGRRARPRRSARSRNRPPPPPLVPAAAQSWPTARYS